MLLKAIMFILYLNIILFLYFFVNTAANVHSYFELPKENSWKNDILLFFEIQNCFFPLLLWFVFPYSFAAYRLIFPENNPTSRNECLTRCEKVHYAKARLRSDNSRNAPFLFWMYLILFLPPIVCQSMPILFRGQRKNVFVNLQGQVRKRFGKKSSSHKIERILCQNLAYCQITSFRGSPRNKIGILWLFKRIKKCQKQPA